MKEKERNVYKGESKTPYKGNRLPQIVHQESRSRHLSGTPTTRSAAILSVMRDVSLADASPSPTLRWRRCDSRGPGTTRRWADMLREGHGPPGRSHQLGRLVRVRLK